MSDEIPYQKLLQESLKDELRVLNAHLPGKQKSLEALLSEESPTIICYDGSVHLFKRKELEYLAGIIDVDEQKSLLLPVVIEVNPGEDEIAIICRGESEEKVVSAILEMPVKTRGHRIVIYKPQLAMIRKVLKTTTQYLFSPKILQ